MGRIIPYMKWKNKKCSKPPTRYKTMSYFGSSPSFMEERWRTSLKTPRFETVRNGCWVVATTQCGRLPLPDSCQVLGCNGFHNWCFFKQVACLTWEFSAKHKIENSENSEGTGFLFLFLNHHQLIRKLGVKMKMCLLPGKLIFSEHQIWGTVRYANPTWRLVVLNQQAM